MKKFITILLSVSALFTFSIMDAQAETCREREKAKCSGKKLSGMGTCFRNLDRCRLPNTLKLSQCSKTKKSCQKSCNDSFARCAVRSMNNTQLQSCTNTKNTCLARCTNSYNKCVKKPQKALKKCSKTYKTCTRGVNLRDRICRRNIRRICGG